MKQTYRDVFEMGRPDSSIAARGALVADALRMGFPPTIARRGKDGHPGGTDHRYNQHRTLSTHALVRIGVTHVYVICMSRGGNPTL